MDDGFTLVAHGRRNKQRARSRTGPATNHNVDKEEEQEEPSQAQISTLQAKIKAWMLKLQRTELYVTLLEQLSVDPFSDIVCFGLGRLSVFRSQLQLALLKLLCDKLVQSSPHGEDVKLVYFDPTHTRLDHSILQAYGFSRLLDNDMGRWRMQQGRGQTLFFMPHCDRWLYSNLVQCNADQLKRMTIVGNSFRGYCERDDACRDYVWKANRISKESVFVLREEEDLIDKTILFESFNDFSCIQFPGEEEDMRMAREL